MDTQGALDELVDFQVRTTLSGSGAHQGERPRHGEDHGRSLALRRQQAMSWLDKASCIDICATGEARFTLGLAVSNACTMRRAPRRSTARDSPLASSDIPRPALLPFAR